MAGTAVTTLAEFLKLNDRSLSDVFISDLVQAGGLLTRLHTEESSNGTVHEYLKETTAPTIGFRPLGSGGANAPGVKTQVSVSLKLLDATAAEDAAAVEKSKDGIEMFMEKQALRNWRQGMHALEKAFFYGTTYDAEAFAGLAENTAYDGLADAQVVPGGGVDLTTYSAWILRTGEDSVSMLNPGGLEIGEIYKSMLYDSNSKGFPGYVAPMLSWFAFKVGSVLDVVRVANLDFDEANTESLIQDGLALFPEDKTPTYCVMSRKSRLAIHKNRIAVSGIPNLPLPTEVDGVPIVISEALVLETPLV